MRKILVVEDEVALRDAYAMILSTEPYQIDMASNGAVALELCKDVRYDLVLLDLMMPVMDGAAFLEAFAIQGVTPSKVILLSNLSAGNDLAKALSLGAYKNVLKADLSPRQLLAMVRYELEA